MLLELGSSKVGMISVTYRLCIVWSPGWLIRIGGGPMVTPIGLGNQLDLVMVMERLDGSRARGN